MTHGEGENLPCSAQGYYRAASLGQPGLLDGLHLAALLPARGHSTALGLFAPQQVRQLVLAEQPGCM